jgi:hypothetical protein
MERDELLDLCERYVRRRGLVSGNPSDEAETAPPVIEIVDGYLHAEISESEKNALLAYVRGPESDLDEAFDDFSEPVLAELEDLADR